MSVFTPVNVNAPLDKKKALLEKLMGQYQASAQRAAGLAHGGIPQLAGLGTAAHGGRPFGGGGMLTGQLPNISAALQRMLGPGGFGHGIPGFEASAAPGMAVANRLGPTPHGMPANRMPAAAPAGNAAQAPGTPGAPVPPSQAPYGARNAVYADPTISAASGIPVGKPVVDPGFYVGDYGQLPSGGGGNAAQAPSGAIPLGNGLYYDPVNDVLIKPNQAGANAPSVQSGPRAGGTFSAV